MFYSDIEKMNSTQFKRLTGVKREAFNQMLEVVNESKACSRKNIQAGMSDRKNAIICYTGIKQAFFI
jgi:hypothetical protein